MSKLKVKLIDRIILIIVVFLIFKIVEISSSVQYNLVITFILMVLFLFSSVILITSHFFSDIGKEKPTLPKKLPSVAVVTYAFNNFKAVEPTVRRLSELNYPIPYNVYVVNDGTMGFLKKYKKVKLITLDKKYFNNNIKATIMNIAFKKLKEDYILCTDGDTIPDKNALINLMGHMKGKVGAVIGYIVPNKANNLLEKIQVYEYALSFGLWARGLSGLDSMFVVVGALNLINRKRFLEVGGFDVNNITEDADLAYAFKKHGYSIRHTIKATATTDIPDTIKEFVRQRVRWYRGACYTWLKYKKMFFNHKVGLFGAFILPYFIFLNLLGISIFLKFIVVSVRRFIEYFYFYISEIISQGFIVFNFFNFNYFFIPPMTIAILLVFGITIFMTLISFSFMDMHIKLKDLPSFFVFILIYGFMITILYLWSITEEFIGIKYYWKKT
jgi:cellulose synthase/poly-beta-1,6-N-acetylglucosamine synthase-like glycosyltransferase